MDRLTLLSAFFIVGLFFGYGERSAFQIENSIEQKRLKKIPCVPANLAGKIISGREVDNSPGILAGACCV